MFAGALTPSIWKLDLLRSFLQQIFHLFLSISPIDIDFCNISSSFFLFSQGICGSNVLLHLRCEPVSYSTFAPQEWDFLGLVSPNNNCRVRFHVKFCIEFNLQTFYNFSDIERNLARVCKRILTVSGQNLDRFWPSVSVYFLMMVRLEHFSIRCPKRTFKLRGSGGDTVS